MFLICSLIVSCKDDKIQNLILEGDLFAKQVITVKYVLPDEYFITEIAWYLSVSPDTGWQKIPGIWTDEIVLLTSYEGKYVKCEVTAKSENNGKVISSSVVSASAVDVKGNPATGWFRDAGFGIMVHYLSSNIVQDKGSQEWNDAVDSFNTDDFALKASEAGAGYVMFTLGQNSGYYCSPNASFDSVLGVNPGDLCSKRDLPMDLIKSLKKYNIPVILYLPSNPPVSNKLVSEKFRYTYGKDSATSQYNQPIYGRNQNIAKQHIREHGPVARLWKRVCGLHRRRG